MVKRPESSLVVIYNERNEVLLLQRNDDPDFWQSVTGTIEDDESPLQTAYRELAEEIGVIFALESGRIIDCYEINQYEIRQQWLHRYAQGVTVNTEYVFAVQIPSNTRIILTEHSDWQWHSKSDAIAKAWSKTNKLAIEKYVPE